VTLLQMRSDVVVAAVDTYCDPSLLHRVSGPHTRSEVAVGAIASNSQAALQFEIARHTGLSVSLKMEPDSLYCDDSHGYQYCVCSRRSADAAISRSRRLPPYGRDSHDAAAPVPTRICVAEQMIVLAQMRSERYSVWLPSV
jgi:hypothetical protein